MNIREKIFNVIEPESGHHHSKFFDIFIMTLIILSVLGVILESFEPLRLEYADAFYQFEKWSVIIFTIEYILRLLTADLLHKNMSIVGAFFKVFISFYGLIDLVAILPFYLPLFVAMDLRFVRILRLLRLFRVMKLTRYNHSMTVVIQVLKDKRPELGITAFVMFILMLLSSSLMYYSEHEAQPEVFPNIVSAFWWAITTLTTVGYGDVYPITALGKTVASFMSLLGILVIALPTGILSSAFFNMTHKKKHIDFCPHCGKDIHQEAQT
ncbi:MAG: ion transporter [Cytophagales bacterium]|nr:ion transporter [Cytophagales bacterium]